MSIAAMNEGQKAEMITSLAALLCEDGGGTTSENVSP